VKGAGKRGLALGNLQIREGKTGPSCNEWLAQCSLAYGQGLEHPFTATAKVAEHLLHCARVGWRGFGLHAGRRARASGGVTRIRAAPWAKRRKWRDRAAGKGRAPLKITSELRDATEPPSFEQQDGQGVGSGGVCLVLRDLARAQSQESHGLSSFLAFPRNVKFEPSEESNTSQGLTAFSARQQTRGCRQ